MIQHWWPDSMIFIIITLSWVLRYLQGQITKIKGSHLKKKLMSDAQRISKMAFLCWFILSIFRIIIFSRAALIKDILGFASRFVKIVSLMTNNSNKLKLESMVIISSDDETKNDWTLWNTFLCNCKCHYNISLKSLLTLWYVYVLYPSICYNDQASSNCEIIPGHIS